MFVTNDDDLYEKVLTLSNHGRARYRRCSRTMQSLWANRLVSSESNYLGKHRKAMRKRFPPTDIPSEVNENKHQQHRCRHPGGARVVVHRRRRA